MEFFASFANSFNRFITILILSLISLAPQPAPQPKPLPLKTAPVSVAIPTKPITTTKPVPWGTTEKIGEHQYRTYVANDPVMGTPAEILTALNVYRKNQGRGELLSDENVCKLAQKRAADQQKMGTLDSHKGLKDYMEDPNHWKELDIKAIGENASYGYILSGTHLIEWVFDSDVEHRDNQLNPSWNLACSGISGVTVDVIFGNR